MKFITIVMMMCGGIVAMYGMLILSYPGISTPEVMIATLCYSRRERVRENSIYKRIGIGPHDLTMNTLFMYLYVFN